MKVLEVLKAFWADYRDRGARLQPGEKPTDWIDFFWKNTVLFLAMSTAIIGNFTTIVESVGLTSTELKLAILLSALLVTILISVRTISHKIQQGQKRQSYYSYKQHQRAVAKVLLLLAILLVFPTAMKFYSATFRFADRVDYVWGHVKSESDNKPLVGVSVGVYGTNGKSLGMDTTDVQGKYIIRFDSPSVPHTVRCNGRVVAKLETDDINKNKRNLIKDILVANPKDHE